MAQNSRDGLGTHDERRGVRLRAVTGYRVSPYRELGGSHILAASRIVL